MASSHSFDINVRHPSGGQSHIIHVRSDMTVEQVKRQFAEKTQIDPNQFKLVFAGTMLNESSTLDTFGLMGYSTLHMIRGRVEVSAAPTANIRDVEDKLGDINLGQNGQGDTNPQPTMPSTSSRKTYNRFFIYCKDVCKEMKPGKLRVRCKMCKDESFELSREPHSWDDVLTTNKIEGTCNNPNCREARYAEFFFKCSGHEDRSSQLNAYTALHMIRANTVEVACASCADVADTVVRFDCNHCMCVDCFIEYCQTNINQRSFVEKPDTGYTIECPDKCQDGYVKEIHHFQLMGRDLYERYKNFAAEEFVLQMGGVLCPAAGCGAGILLEDNNRRVQCPTCRHVFCKTCKNPYHIGICAEAHNERQTTAQGGNQFDQGRLQQSRWDEETERFIRENEGIKRCPSCQTQIEKNDGCNHMTCRCRHEFCWLCLIPWTGQCREAHWFGPRRIR